MKAERPPATLRLNLLPSWLGVCLLWLLHGLPLALQAAIGNTLGALMALLPSKRRRVVATNLALCFPEASPRTRQRWLRQTFQASLRATLEHGMLWWSSERRLRRLIHLENPDAALGDGKRPVIWLAPHFVGLDMGGIRLAAQYRLNSVYSRQKNAAFDDILKRGRTRFGKTTLFARQEGIRPMIRSLRNGEPFYYLPDMDLGARDSVFAPFFGVPAATITGLARIAGLAGAAVVPCVTRQLPVGQGYVVRFYPAWENFPSGDLEADARQMNAFIEERVREMPEQYYWLHKRFKTRPPGEANPYEQR
jgi:KDO2-lipid IV(A) lauroyltransferase